MEADHSPAVIVVERPARITSDEPQSEISNDDKSTNGVTPSRSTLEGLRMEGTRELVTWNGPDDPENPKNWSYAYKWWVTTIICIVSLNVSV
jgi:hypothetical protein